MALCSNRAQKPEKKKQCSPLREELGNLHFSLFNCHCSLSHGELYRFTCFLPGQCFLSRELLSWFNIFLFESYALPSSDLVCCMADLVPLTLLFGEDRSKKCACSNMSYLPFISSHVPAFLSVPLEPGMWSGLDSSTIWGSTEWQLTNIQTAEDLKPTVTDMTII